MYKRVVILCLIVLQIGIVFGQNKKDIIEILEQRVDSLSIEFNKEQKHNFEKVSELDARVKSLTEIINQKDLISTQLKADLLKTQTEKAMLQDELHSLVDSLNNLSAELIKIKALTAEAEDEVPENNYNALIGKFRQEGKDVTEIKKWLTDEILGPNLGDKLTLTPKVAEYVYDVNSDEFSLDSTALYKKWSGVFDLKHDFFYLFDVYDPGCESTRKLNIEYLGELNRGSWFMITISVTCKGSSDVSKIVNVIKVIPVGWRFYIDNYISLTPFNH